MAADAASATNRRLVWNIDPPSGIDRATLPTNHIVGDRRQW
jgi:hypothetical protein